jgi:putative transposase
MPDRKRTRLPGFDYSVSRYYYFTICVKDHIWAFGFVKDNIMHLSQNGIIALEQWDWLGNQYPYIELVAFVVMPNHVHGIILIDANYYYQFAGMHHGNIAGMGRDPSLHLSGMHHGNIAGMGRDPSLQLPDDTFKIKPLTELIGAYKTTVSKRIHLVGDKDFKWQNSFYDHIIRNAWSLNNIISYIKSNPENWYGF